MRPAEAVVPGFVPGELASGVFALVSVKISAPRGGATLVGRFATARLSLAEFSGQGLAVGWFQP